MRGLQTKAAKLGFYVSQGSQLGPSTHYAISPVPETRLLFSLFQRGSYPAQDGLELSIVPLPFTECWGFPQIIFLVGAMLGMVHKCFADGVPYSMALWKEPVGDAVEPCAGPRELMGCRPLSLSQGLFLWRLLVLLCQLCNCS